MRILSLLVVLTTALSAQHVLANTVTDYAQVYRVEAANSPHPHCRQHRKQSHSHEKGATLAPRYQGKKHGKCWRQPRDYHVWYYYQGHRYHATLPYRPHHRIPVHVTVSPVIHGHH